MGRRIVRRTAQQETPESASSAASSAARERIEAEFGIPPKPEYAVPVLPADLGDLSDARLMEMFREFSEWAGFMGVRLALAEVEAEEAESELRTLQSRLLLTEDMSGREAKVTLAKARVETHDEIAKAREHVHYTRAYRKMLGRRHEDVERCAFLLSRELTRRTSNPSRDRRVGP